jgi:predicted dithiol-disulfide oxidoreductase (DUF899 family)
MVEVEKEYFFEGPRGMVPLPELFAGDRQLIIYHFMFEPGEAPPGQSGGPYEEGCSGCSFIIDNIGHPAHFHARNTSLVLVSRAPLSKIEPFKRRMGWRVPWYSSHGSEFNYNFQVTSDESIRPIQDNYQGQSYALAQGTDLSSERRAAWREYLSSRRQQSYTTPILPMPAAWTFSTAPQLAGSYSVWPAGRLEGLSSRLAPNTDT